MHRRPFATDHKATGECQHAAKKLVYCGAPRNMAIMLLHPVNNEWDTQAVVFKAGKKGDDKDQHRGGNGQDDPRKRVT